MEKIIKSRPTFLFFLSSFCNRNYTMIKLLSSLQVSGNRVHFLNIKHTLVAISSYFLQFSSGKTKMVGRLRHAPAGEGQMQSSGNILLVFFFSCFFFPQWTLQQDSQCFAPCWSSFPNFHLPSSVSLHILHSLTPAGGWNCHCIRNKRCEVHWRPQARGALRWSPAPSGLCLP